MGFDPVRLEVMWSLVAVVNEQPTALDADELHHHRARGGDLFLRASSTPAET